MLSRTAVVEIGNGIGSVLSKNLDRLVETLRYKPKVTGSISHGVTEISQ